MEIERTTFIKSVVVMSQIIRHKLTHNETDTLKMEVYENVTNFRKEFVKNILSNSSLFQGERTFLKQRGSKNFSSIIFYRNVPYYDNKSLEKGGYETYIVKCERTGRSKDNSLDDYQNT